MFDITPSRWLQSNIAGKNKQTLAVEQVYYWYNKIKYLRIFDYFLKGVNTVKFDL